MTTRVFQSIELQIGSRIQLDPSASHHVARVLRAQVHDALTIFNGQGGEYLGQITEINKKGVLVLIKEHLTREAESPLELYLAQGISRGEKMDYTIQKAVELGVKKIIPLFTEYCNVRLDTARREKRLQHWQSIIISACEQCGRNRIPEITSPDTLENSLSAMQADFCFILSPNSEQKLSLYHIEKQHSVLLLIGPEGGLSAQETQQAEKFDFLPLTLGPRILRTETAAVAAIAALQCYFGDMG